METFCNANHPRIIITIFLSSNKLSRNHIVLFVTHALYLMDGYSPRVEQRVASCSAIASSAALFPGAMSGLYMLPKADGRSRE